MRAAQARDATAGDARVQAGPQACAEGAAAAGAPFCGRLQASLHLADPAPPGVSPGRVPARRGRDRLRTERGGAPVSQHLDSGLRTAWRPRPHPRTRATAGTRRARTTDGSSALTSSRGQFQRRLRGVGPSERETERACTSSGALRGRTPARTHARVRMLAHTHTCTRTHARARAHNPFPAPPNPQPASSRPAGPHGGHRGAPGRCGGWRGAASGPPVPRCWGVWSEGSEVVAALGDAPGSVNV